MADAPSGGTTVCLIRHGDAGESLADPVRDRGRRLTPKGRRQSAVAGAALDRVGLRPRVAVTSRLVRAIQTADAAIEGAGRKARTIRHDALEPHAAPEEAADALAAARERGGGGRKRDGLVVWLVGHDPHLSRLLAFWLAADDATVALKKGSVAVLRCEDTGRGGGRLRALWQPKDLKRLVAAAGGRSRRGRARR
jgi:phosphohistidine phosphatase SixA